MRSAWASAYLPSLTTSFNTGTSRTSSSLGQDDFGQPTERPDAVSFSSSNSQAILSASWTLFDGLRNVNNVGSAKASQQALDAGVDVASAQLRANVSLAYYDVVRAELLVTVQEALLAAAREQLEATERRFQVASAQQVDVLGARIDVSQSEVALERALADVDDRSLELRRVMGLEERMRFDLADSLPVVFDPELLQWEALTTIALQNNPDVRQASANAESANRQAAAAKGTYWPTITVVVGCLPGDRGNVRRTHWTVGLDEHVQNLLPLLGLCHEGCVALQHERLEQRVELQGEVTRYLQQAVFHDTAHDRIDFGLGRVLAGDHTLAFETRLPLRNRPVDVGQLRRPRGATDEELNK